MAGESDFDASEMLGWVERQAGMGPRRTGSAAGAEVEEFLEGKLREFGFESVRKEPIPVTHWEAREASLEVGEAGDGGGLSPVDAFPIPYTAFTPDAGPDGGLEAPLVWADPRRLFHFGRWRGAVVVTDICFPPLDTGVLARFAMGEHDPDGTAKKVCHPATWVRLGWHLYRKAARCGAAAFVGIVRDQPGGTCRMWAPYGFKERDILDKPVPGFWAGRAEGARLRDLARKGTGRARIRLEGVRRPAVAHNIVGELPGESDEAIVLHSHHDSPFDSPVEDATGVSVTLALARHFARRRDLRRRLVVLFTTGHFYGSLGTREFIRKHRSGLVRRTAIEISIEHVAREAKEGPEGKLVPTGRPEVSGIFVPLNRRVTEAVLEELKEHDVGRALILPAEGPLGDYPPTDGGDWYEAGVPVVNHISNPVYLLTDEDALEWVDADRMAALAGVFSGVVRRLDGMSRKEIRAVDSRWHLLKMRLVKRIARARTTCFGLKPVH
ncbi:MAG: M28 family peptidase [Planctomycetota bacterium]